MPTVITYRLGNVEVVPTVITYRLGNVEVVPTMITYLGMLRLWHCDHLQTWEC